MVLWLVLVILLAVACLFCLLLLRRQGEQVAALKKSSKVKSALIRAMSREIRTSLQSVNSMAEIVSKDDLYLSKGEKKSISERLLYDIDLISTLLDEVSAYIDESQGGHALHDERFSPNLLCQHCIDANTIHVSPGVRLVFKNQMGESVFVSADYHIVELVLNKLIYIACQFTQKGEIRVGYNYMEVQHLLTLFVEDTGDGIPRDRRTNLFNWFEGDEVDVNTTEFDLSVAQRLATKIGGIIRNDSTYIKGTRMEFTLPVR